MQHYTTAKEILEASLRNIEGGGWVCGALACSKIDGLNLGGSFIVEDEPMGCALGLISTFGGHGLDETYEIHGRTYESFRPAYPAEDTVSVWTPREGFKNDGMFTFGHGDFVTVEVGPASAAVLEARDALEGAVPSEFWEDHFADSGDESVYEYNDEGIATPKQAAEWFRAALATLDAPVAA